MFSTISLLIISIGAKVLARPVSKLSKIMDGIKSHGDLEIETNMLNSKTGGMKLENCKRVFYGCCRGLEKLTESIRRP